MDKKSFGFVLLDPKMRGSSGAEVLKKTRESGPETVVIVTAAYGNVGSALDGSLREA